MLRKRWFMAAMAAVLAAGMSVPAFADDRDKIDTVRLQFHYDEEPASGESIHTGESVFPSR